MAALEKAFSLNSTASFFSTYVMAMCADKILINYSYVWISVTKGMPHETLKSTAWMWMSNYSRLLKRWKIHFPAKFHFHRNEMQELQELYIKEKNHLTKAEDLYPLISQHMICEMWR